MCLALSNNDAQQAMILFWEMPLMQLFAFTHAYMQNNGMKCRPLSSQNVLSQVFKNLGKDKSSNDTSESKDEWFDEGLGEVEYIR
jgi:hypothetical protein